MIVVLITDRASLGKRCFKTRCSQRQHLMGRTWWLRIQRYSVQHLTPSVEPWPLWLPSASSLGSLGCGTGTIPVHTQMAGCGSKSGGEQKTKVHVWTWDLHPSVVCKLQMHSSSLKSLIYMEMKEQGRSGKIILFFFHMVEDFIA